MQEQGVEEGRKIGSAARMCEFIVSFHSFIWPLLHL